LWPLRSLLLERKRGWLILWSLLVTIGILSTPAAAPSSIEGVLYSRLPMWYHLMGLPEITLQTLVFSIWLVWWERQSVLSHAPAARKENPLVAEIVKAVMTACFAYIGYAVGGLLLAAMANANAAATGTGGVDIEAVRQRAHHIAPGAVFMLFWLLDALVPWLYQTLVFGSSFIPTVMMLGFFPAVIITVSLWLNNRRFTVPERR
jgi:hypothetical protein